MARSPASRNWKGEDVSTPLAAAGVATPAAALSLLAAGIAYPIDAATAPYVGCARLFDGLTTLSPGIRYMGVSVAPGGKGARAAITRSCVPSFATGTGAPPYNNECWSAYGGTSGADVVLVAAAGDFPGYDYSAIADRAFDFATSDASQHIVLSADANVPGPAAAQDRLFELEPLGHPKIEPFAVTYAAGFSVVITMRVGDLTTL